MSDLKIQMKQRNGLEWDSIYPKTMADNIIETSNEKIMTSAERTKLAGMEDNANNYSHPANHPATIITQDSTHRFVTDAEKSTWNGKQDALGFSPEDIANKGTANGYASLGSDGKVPTSQIPAVAITDTYTAANETAMLALSIQKGDVCVRTDINKSYINTTGNNNTISDWQELKSPSDTVTSVNGQTGVVSLTAGNVGAEPTFAKNTAFNKNFGTTSSTVAEGNHTHNGMTQITVDVVEPSSPSTGDFWYAII